MAKMEPELKAKWVAALRSGEYKQSRHYLKRKTTEGVFGYCCLGVFGEVCGLTWGTDTYLGSEFPSENGARVDSKNRTAYYSDEFAEKYGLGRHTELDSMQLLLSDKNDNEGMDFNAIAAFIEKNDAI